jgi:hypothetical protein
MTESLESVKRKLEGIKSEHSARMELASSKLAESDKATAEGHKKFLDNTKRFVERLQEMNKAQREAAANQGKPKELAFGIEEDDAPDDMAAELAELERARLARRPQPDEQGSFLEGPPKPTPSRWAQEHPAPEPVAQTPPRQAPPARRPPQRPAPDDDDDFGSQSWLS